MLRGYDGARTGRRTDGWITSGSSANAEIGPALARLRARSRDLVRNNPYAGRIVDVWAANVVGTGIMPQSRTGDDRLDAKVDALFARFADECDAAGQLDFAGLQTLVMRAVVESGEALCRFRPRRPQDGLAVPLQLQILEGDYLDSSRTGILAEGQGPVTLGVEFDPNVTDRRAAYWLWRQHPGEVGVLSAPLSSVRVPADEVAHVYRKARIGQVRGVPFLAPIITKARDLDDYHEAALVKAKIEACFSAFVTQPDGADGPGVGPLSTDDDGNRVEGFEPGMIEYLRPGEGIEFSNPTASPNFDPYTLHSLMAMAVGAGVTYDQLTGDLRQANYSSLRAGKIEFRRLVEQAQYQMLVPMFCAPVWRQFIATAITAGLLPDRPQEGYPCEWNAPAHEPIDPLKDLRADVMAVRAGAMTLPQLIARYGYDPRRQLAEIARINAELDRLGIALDSDPRRVSQNGGAQSSPTPGDTPDA